MMSLSVINFDEIIFELIHREEFDVNQMRCGYPFFVGWKATVLYWVFDLDQMGVDQLYG